MSRRPNLEGLLEVTHDASLRARETQIVMDLFDVVCGYGEGRLVFVTGREGAGKSTLVADLLSRLSRDALRPTVLAGTFSSTTTPGRFVGWQLPVGRMDMPTALTALGQAAATGAAIAAAFDPSGLLKTATSIAALVGQAAQAGGFAGGLGAATTGTATIGPIELAYAIERLAAEDRPLVVAIDDLSSAEPQLPWQGLFLNHLLIPLLRARPILAIVTASALDRSSQKSGFELTIEELAASNVAVGMHLEPLSAEDLPHIEPRLAADLTTATAGMPGWIARLLQDWHRSGSVEEADGVWGYRIERPQSASETVRQLVTGLLFQADPSDPMAPETAQGALTFGALEGMSFTAEAVAIAMDRDPDVLIDWIDDHLVASDGRPGLLVDEGFRVLSARGSAPPRHLARYRFTSRLVWLAFRPNPRFLTEDGLRERVDRYTEALVRSYAGHIEFIATTLARLRLLIGDLPGVAFYERVLDTHAREDEQTLLIQKEVSKYNATSDRNDLWSDENRVATAQRLLRAGLAIKYRSAGSTALQGFLTARALASAVPQGSPLRSTADEIGARALLNVALASALNGALGDAIIFEEAYRERCSDAGLQEEGDLSTVRLLEILSLLLHLAEQGASPRFTAQLNLRFNKPDEIPARFDGIFKPAAANTIHQARLAALQQLFGEYAEEAVVAVDRVSARNRAIINSSYHRALGRRAADLHDHGRASYHYRTAINFAAEDAEERMESSALLGESLVAEGQYESARQALRNAIRDCLQLGLVKRLPYLLREVSFCEWRSEGAAGSLPLLGHALNVSARLRHQNAGALWVQAALLLLQVGRPAEQVSRCVAMATAAYESMGLDSADIKTLLSNPGLPAKIADTMLASARECWKRNGGESVVESVVGVKPADTDVYLAAFA